MYYARDASGQLMWRMVCYVVRLRADGFMLVAPAHAEVHEHFVSEENLEIFAVHEEEALLVETVRGRAVGPVQALLIDVPSVALEGFRKVSKAAFALETYKLEADGSGVRPNRASAAAVADSWIVETMDEDTAGEYATADSEGPGAPEEEQVGPAAYKALQEQLEQLKAELAQQQRQKLTPMATGTVRAPSTPGLLGSVPPAPPAAPALERLRQMAGPPPARIGQVERQVHTPAAAGPLETFQQEQALEAIDGEELDELTQMQMLNSSDPMQKLVLLQMQHLRLLSQQMAGKQPQDAIHAALSTGGESTSGSSAGIKGCLAREAYVKVTMNLVTFAQTVEQNALQELGLTAGDVTPGLLRDYVEKRIPLGNMRLLTQVAYLAANAWEIGNKIGSREMQGFAAKMMCFVEQTALDEGRTGLSWLLTGLPEPNYSVTQKNVVRYGAKPFSRLSAASWVAANVGYLKDLEFLDNRIKSTDKPDAKSDAKETPKNPPNRPRRRKPKTSGEAGESSGTQA
eukprot:s567_g31.t1